jgi:hypothetical protein
MDPFLETVTIAHVGDSAAIIGCGTNLVFETKDHDFDASDVARVEAAGGEIREFPTAMKTVRRVYAKGQPHPALALSRSIGDVDAHKYGILSEPTVSENKPFGAGNLLILASDGVWNVVSKDSVLNIATIGSAEDAANRVANCAKESWPSSGTDYIDDISIIVIKAVPNMQTAEEEEPQVPAVSAVQVPITSQAGNALWGSQRLVAPFARNVNTVDMSHSMGMVHMPTHMPAGEVPRPKADPLQFLRESSGMTTGPLIGPQSIGSFHATAGPLGSALQALSPTHAQMYSQTSTIGLSSI